MQFTTSISFSNLSRSLILGQEFIDQFVDLILRCGKYDQTATLKLINWKSSREPFWRTTKDEDESYGESASDSSHEIHPQYGIPLQEIMYRIIEIA